MAWFTVFKVVIVVIAFKLACWPDAKSIVAIAITASFASIAAASSAAAFVAESFAPVLVASSFVAMAAIPSTKTDSLTRRLAIQ